jgi:hypothetical protein
MIERRKAQTGQACQKDVVVLSDAELQALAKSVTPRECTVDQGGIIWM